MHIRIKYFLIAAFVCTTAFADMTAQVDVLKFVDPMIGTGGHGHTYPGATTPFGLVQLSPDTDDTGWDWCSGYHYQDSTIMGFSHTHLSGTGISDLADVLLMPYTGSIQLFPGSKSGDQTGYRSKFLHKDEVASPGYYAVKLLSHDIFAELTASQDMGIHRYTFPSTDSAQILVDLQHGLDRHRSWLTERVLESALQVIDSVTISGYRISSGWANVQPVYFQIRFSKPFYGYGMALHDIFRQDASLMRGRNVKGVFTFKTTDHEKIEIAVRISDTPFTDTIALLPSFDEVRTETENKWMKVLNAINIQAEDSIRQLFYTALYHTCLAPNKLSSAVSDSDEQKPGFNDEYGTLSQWDTYRAAFALNTLIRPEVTEGIVGTMLRACRNNGYLPVWKLWHDDVHCMIGTPSVPILVEAVRKGYGHDRLEEIKRAVTQTMINDNPVGPWSILDRYGYIPYNSGEIFSVSKTLEMAYASACARDFMTEFFPEEKKLTDIFEKRALSYRNVFDTSTGFFRGRDERGRWKEPFDPAVTSEDSFVEATPWQYLFHVQHDIPGMMALHGGRDGFIRKLDALFSAPAGAIDSHILDITGLIGQYAHGNEPSHHVAYLYNAADMPWKTQERVHDICTRMYRTGPDGLSGNEDCGQMSAWYIFSALGFYPVHPASTDYYVGTPLINNAFLQLANGKTLTIEVKRPASAAMSSGDKLSVTNYIREVQWNGKPLNYPLISHAQIMQGGTMKFIMSATPVQNAFKPFYSK
jgi:predicted alpha-1,2-mannosidase